MLAGTVPLPQGSVLIIGGGMVGCEVAEYLATLGDNPIVGKTEVTIIEMLEDIGLDMVPEVRVLGMKKLRENNVRVLNSAKVKEFLDDGVVVIKDDQEETLTGYKRIVLAMGAKPVDTLSEIIREFVNEVYVIGDAQNACRALEAISDGAQVGRQI